MTAKISPSLMCVDFEKLRDTLCVFEKEGIEYLHVDIMDGAFVPNITLGTDFCKKLRKMTGIPATLQKIADAREYLDAHGRKDVEIEVGGNVSFENAVRMRKMGTDIFVAGSSSVFSASDSMENNILRMRECIGGAL